MSIFLIRSAISQSSSYPNVLTRLGGPRSRPNPHLKFVEVPGITRGTRRSVKWIRIMKIIKIVRGGTQANGNWKQGAEENIWAQGNGKGFKMRKFIVCTVHLRYYRKKKKPESSVLLQSFSHFSYNENPTRALNSSSLKCCLPSTDPITGGKKFTYAYGGSR